MYSNGGFDAMQASRLGCDKLDYSGLESSCENREADICHLVPGA